MLVEEMGGEGWDRAHVKAAKDQSATLTQRFQRSGDYLPCRSEHNSRIKLGGRLRKGGTGPFCAEFECKPLMTGVPGGRIHVHVPVHCHLNTALLAGAQSLQPSLPPALTPQQPH